MKLIFKRKQQEAEGVFSFAFAPSSPLAWVAGQSIRLEIPTGGYDVEEKRFTISSASFENQIVITTRLSNSPFKKALNGLKAGEGIQAGSIEGDFVWQETASPHIFVAGGMGITPFYAMLKQRAQDGQKLSSILFYNDSVDRMPFVQQLNQWQGDFTEFKVHYITNTRLKASSVTSGNSIFYISGPTKMVVNWQNSLLARGILRENIKTDQFTGY